MESMRPGDALLIVDVQNDFLPGGALAVPQGRDLIPALRRYINLFLKAQLRILATRDWHPSNHCSFRGAGRAMAGTLRRRDTRRAIP